MKDGPIIKAKLVNWKPKSFMDITANEGNLDDMIQDNGEKLTRVTERFCPKCGHKLSRRMIYCPNCGSKVSN